MEFTWYSCCSCHDSVLRFLEALAVTVLLSLLSSCPLGRGVALSALASLRLLLLLPALVLWGLGAAVVLAVVVCAFDLCSKSSAFRPMLMLRLALPSPTTRMICVGAVRKGS